MKKILSPLPPEETSIDNFLSLPAIQNLQHSNISRHQVDLYVSCHAFCSKTPYTAKENLNLYGCNISHSGVSKKIGLAGFFH